MAQIRKINDDILLRLYHDGVPQKDIAKHFDCTPVAVCNRLKRLLPPPETVLDKFDLTDKEKSFVVEKAKGKSSTQAVLASSYEAGSMESAKTIGTGLMKKPEIKQAIDEIMETCGLTRSYRVKKLKKHVDNRDPAISLKALDQSWRLDGSYQETGNAPVAINLNVDVTDARYRQFQGIGNIIDVTPRRATNQIERNNSDTDITPNNE